MRVRRGRVVFLSDSRADYSGNIAFMYDELLRQDPGADVIGLFKPRLRARRSVRDMARIIWASATAQTIVLDDYYPLIYAFKIRAGTRLVQVWHAAGAFKKVGYSRTGLPGGPTPGSLIHRNYTDVTVSSEAVRGDYAEAFGVPISRVHALGVPRTDAFFDEDAVAAAAARIRHKFLIPDGKRVALFAPTFRGQGQRSAYFDYDSVDFAQLAADLGDDWVILVKMHPFVTPLADARPELAHVAGVIDVSAEREITDLLMAADVLITDYSSTIFEYALLHRPIVLFCPDLEEYTADRDFYYPFERYVSGPLVREAAGLADAIRTAAPAADHDEFVQEFMGACDGQSAARIVSDIVLRPRQVRTRGRQGGRDTSYPMARGEKAGSATLATHATTASTLNVAIAHAARIGIAGLYMALRILPRRRKIVLMSRENNSLSADFADVVAGLRRAAPDVNIVTLVRMVPTGLRGKISYIRHIFSQVFHVATARVLLLDTYSMVASLPRHGRGLTVIQMWHALGALKKFGLSIVGTPEGRDPRLARAMRMHRGYDVVLASGPACRDAYAEAFGVGQDQVAVAPLPRVDRLRDEVRAAAVRGRLRVAHPAYFDRPIAVFAPTLRLNGPSPIDVAKLSAQLADAGVHLVVKSHPLVRTTLPAGIDTAPGFSTQDLLYVADYFVTDYSSALFEASVLGLPCYFLAPDLDDYVASRNFYLNFPGDLPGPVVRSAAELAAAMTAGLATAEDARKFADRWVQIPAARGGSATPCTDAIVELVLGHLR